MDLEIKRGLFHLLLSLIIIAIVTLIGVTYSLILFTLTLIIGLTLAKIAMPRRVILLDWFIKHFDRKEFMPGKGGFSYLLGATLVLAILPLKIAFASILFLGFADSLARLVGRNAKIRYFHSNKSLEGTLVGGLIGVIASAYFIGIMPSLFAGIVAMFVESFDHPYYLDDNWVVPLIFGLVCYLVI